MRSIGKEFVKRLRTWGLDAGLNDNNGGDIRYWKIWVTWQNEVKETKSPFGIK